MDVLSKIRDAGFVVSLADDSFEIVPASALTPNQREFLKQHKSEIITELRAETSGLSATDRQKLLAYLEAIEESDPEMIDELLTECAKDSDKLAWALQWADKVLAGQRREPEQPMITCSNCSYFQSYYNHGGGAGACAAGVMSYGVCWWADSIHSCNKFKRKPSK